MVVRCKFRLTEWKNSEGGRYKDGKWVSALVTSVVLVPVTSGDPNSENKLFWDATPTGRIELSIVNPEAIKELEILKEYYVDFTLAE